MIDFIKDAGMALVWILLGYFTGESNARKDKKITKPNCFQNGNNSKTNKPCILVKLRTRKRQ